MKSFTILISIIFLSSCVSSKKYKMLEENLSSVKVDLAKAKESFRMCNEEKEVLILANNELTLVINNKEAIIQMQEQDNSYKSDKIRSLEENVAYLRSNNKLLNERIDVLTESSKLNTGIVKKLLEDLENQNLKVLNLTLAMEKQDSLNIQSVKKTKKNMSDEKLRKSLEKLGFVFY